MTIPSIKNLTREETRELAAQCLGMLSLDERLGIVLEAFDKDELEELAVWLEDEIEKLEGSE